MQSGQQFLTVITNGTMDTRRCNLTSTKAMKPVILWNSDSEVSEDGRNIVLGPRGTIAMLWRGE
jgi:hypothetical protein